MVSHAEVTAKDLDLDELPGKKTGMPLFRRDCLLARIGALTLFVCHFKSPWPDAGTAWSVRRLEALAVKRLIERRFAGLAEALWLIIGDLNEPREEPCGERAIAPLIKGFSNDLMERLPDAERWSYYDRESASYSRPDFLLASAALAARWPDAKPSVLREGLDREIARYEGTRLPDVGQHRPHASDHAALVVEFDGL